MLFLTCLLIFFFQLKYLDPCNPFLSSSFYCRIVPMDKNYDLAIRFSYKRVYWYGHIELSI